MNILFSAREKSDATGIYTPISTNGAIPLSVTQQRKNRSERYETVEVTVKNTSAQPWEGVLHLETPFPKKDPAFFMPAFLYGTNRGESPLHVYNAYPRMRQGELSKPASPWWMVRSDRLSHPAVLAYDSGMVYGIAASPYYIQRDGEKRPWSPAEGDGKFYQYCGYSSNINQGTIGYTLGYENAPWLFVDSHRIRDRAPLAESCFRLEAEETVHILLRIYYYSAESAQGINSAMAEIYTVYHQPPRKGPSPKTAVQELSNTIGEYAWIAEDDMYATFVFERGDKFEQRKTGTFSWINGLAVATPQLMAALRTDRADLRDQALRCIDKLLKTAVNPKSGLPFDNQEDDGTWNLNGWWYDSMQCSGHSSYVTAQGIYFLLKAYDYERKHSHVTHTDWLEFAEPILMHLQSGLNPEGEYPYLWSEKTGFPVEYDSFGGVWCLAAMAYYLTLTGADEDILARLETSAAHYYHDYVEKMVCYATPLDTNKAVDSEGILAYLRAVRLLHTLTGKEIYLDHLKDALHYEFSFKFCYNSPIKTPPLSTVGWSSCGGSVTSVCNPHIHPMSSSVVDEQLYYLQFREDGYVRSRMEDTIHWGCQCYNTFDKEFGYGKKGWMSERFCHSEGLLVERFPSGNLSSTWHCLMAWGGSCIIDGLAGTYWEQFS